jgi:hypothetical protein
MKTCKYGCGKMKKGGKVTGVKKMAKGGSSKGSCPKGYHMTAMGICEENILHTLSSKIGLGVTGAGIAGLGIKKIADAVKKGKAIKELKKSNPAMTTKEARKQLASNATEEKRKGGSVKKYAAGGNTGGYAPAQKGGDNTKMGIYGIPNAGRTDSLGFKKGGSTTSRAVKPGCRGGMVKDASGNCVAERKFKAGGSLKPVPAGKVGLSKLPTAVRNKMGFQKKGGAVKKK